MNYVSHHALSPHPAVRGDISAMVRGEPPPSIPVAVVVAVMVVMVATVTTLFGLLLARVS